MERPDETRMFRHPGPDDAHALAALFAASWEAGYRGLIPDELVDRMSTIETILSRTRRPNPTKVSWVVELDGQLVAASSSGLARDDDPPPTRGEVYSFYAHPDHWRHGHGRALMQHVLVDLARRGFQEAVLWSLTDNPRARAFYDILGFQVEIERVARPLEEFELDHTRYRIDLPERTDPPR